MSFPPHLEYRDSGIKWLGTFPTHWRVARFKEIFSERDERSTDGYETLLSVSAYTGVGPRAEMLEDGEPLSRAETLEGYKVCYQDDLIINIMLAWNRGLGFSPTSGIVSPSYSVFRKLTDDRIRFLDYLVRDDRMILYYKAFSSGVIDSRLRLYPNVFGTLYCPLPPLEEQDAIVEFLDRETGRIDCLMQEQRRLIELLKEKRRAIISHAVTKGLNPDAPMKPSGIGWLGDVPAHWNVKQLKYSAQITTGFAFPSERFLDEGCPVLRISDIDQEGRVLLNNCKCIEPQSVSDYSNYSVQSGDVVMAMTGGTVGKTGRYTEEQPLLLNQRVCAIRPANSFDSEFLWFLLSSSGYKEHIALKAFGGAQPNISDAELLEYRYAHPPVQEQIRIGQFLSQETGKIDVLMQQGAAAVSLLQERRSALISAAVTGKVDIRQAVLEPVG